MASSESTASCFAAIGAKLYLNGDHADMHFLVKDDGDTIERIPAHKIVLAAASDEFDRMFYSDLKEEGDVTIVDVSAASFKKFLQFFYFTKVQFAIEEVKELMYLGEKYHIAQCMTAENELLQRNPAVAYVCQVYQLAIFFNQTELKMTCEEFISKNTKEVLVSDGFLACDKAALADILKMDELLCDETTVFEACKSWAKKASQQNELTRELIQLHLGKSFYEIRFRSMSFLEFSSLLPSYGDLFSAIEYKEIIQLITNEGYQPIFFNGSRRDQFSYEWNVAAKTVCNRLHKRCWNVDIHSE